MSAKGSWSFLFPSRFIGLEKIIAVQDKPPAQQDINKASFCVVTPGRTFELMAHDADEKLRYRTYHERQEFKSCTRSPTSY